jgi:hypothetical protein
MFLSLVRPDKISSPMTSIAALLGGRESAIPLSWLRIVYSDHARGREPLVKLAATACGASKTRASMH